MVGSQKMAVFDDIETTEKLRVYDKGVQRPAYDSYGDSLSLRFGDIAMPRIDIREPLRLECHLHGLHRQRPDAAQRWPQWPAGASVLEAGQRSLERNGEPVGLGCKCQVAAARE